MAHVHSPRVEALASRTEESDNSDVEFVCQGTGTQLQYNPLGAKTRQFLSKRLEVQHDGTSVTAPLGLGPPCRTINIDGDGNCFFKAISEAFSGTDQYHLTLREVVVKHLESYAATYKSILRTEYNSVSEYIRKSRMQSPGTWATEVEIQAAADVLGVSIYTYYRNRWVKYSCKGVQVSDQGIYLENRGCHYNTVVCVKDPNTQSCYEYCKLDTIGKGVTQSFSPLPLESTEHEYNSDPAEEEEDSEYECGDDCECDGTEEDCQFDSDLVEEGVRQSEQMEEKLSWSGLNTSWGTFVEWLGDRWWDQVPEEVIMSLMNKNKRQPGDVVIATPFGDTPGAVFSVSVKTKNSVLTTDVVICGRFYRCVQLFQGKYSDPIMIIQALVHEMEHVHLLPRLKTIPRTSMYFCATHVAEELRFMMEKLPPIFWGTYKRPESSSQYQQTIKHLQMTRTRSVDPQRAREKCYHRGAIMHCETDLVFGYLFEVITDQGRKITVTFDRLGFTVGNGSYFYEITSVLSYISTVEQVMFIPVPRSWDAVNSPKSQMMETGETDDSHYY